MRMGRRWILLALPLVLLTALLALASAALSVRFEEPRVAYEVDGLPEVSRHPVPQGIPLNAGRPLAAFWLVRQEQSWKAFADRDTGPRGCPLEWRVETQRFNDRCWGSFWDRSGRLVRGPGPRDLEEFSVTETSDGWVVVDLSGFKSGVR